MYSGLAGRRTNAGRRWTDDPLDDDDGDDGSVVVRSVVVRSVWAVVLGEYTGCRDSGLLGRGVIATLRISISSSWLLYEGVGGCRSSGS